jgi:hypothetical protein
MRNEFAIHRWDFAGDGELGPQLLAQPELTEHAVAVLGRLLVAAGARKDPQADQGFAVRLRSPGTTDVRVVVDAGQAGWAPAAQRAVTRGDRADNPGQQARR